MDGGTPPAGLAREDEEGEVERLRVGQADKEAAPLSDDLKVIVRGEPVFAGPLLDLCLDIDQFERLKGPAINDLLGGGAHLLKRQVVGEPDDHDIEDGCTEGEEEEEREAADAARAAKHGRTGSQIVHRDNQLQGVEPSGGVEFTCHPGEPEAGKERQSLPRVCAGSSTSTPRTDQRLDPLADNAGRDIVANDDLANPGREDEGEATGDDLLVTGHGIEDPGNVEVVHPGSGADGIDQGVDAVFLLRGEQVQGYGNGGCAFHAFANGFAVAKAAIVSHGLEGVSNRVSIIENATQPTLALIRGDHLGLDLAATGDQGDENGRVERQQTVEPGLDRMGKCRVADDTIFDRLIEPCLELAAREGRQDDRVDQYR